MASHPVETYREFRDREFDAFISYSHAEAELAKRLFRWLTESAGLKVWFDQQQMGPGPKIISTLLAGIDNSRAVIVLATAEAAKSPHVSAEFKHARETCLKEPNFSLVLITPDVTQLPTTFKTAGDLTATGLTDGWLSTQDAAKLIANIVGLAGRPTGEAELFVSLSSHQSERAHADAVCRKFASAGLGLVADVFSPEKSVWRDRVKRLIAETRGHLLILPDRPVERQRRFLDEVTMAAECEPPLPLFVCAHPNAGIPQEVETLARVITRWDGVETSEDLETEIDYYRRDLRTTADPSELFLACEWRNRRERNEQLRYFMEQVTSRRCRIGFDLIVTRTDLKDRLVQMVRDAKVVIADIASSVDADGLPILNLNTCIEAGIALGASRDCVLVARGDEHTKGKTQQIPFMLEACQPKYYADDVELIGNLYRLLAPFRRRLLTGK